jgi:hypothetical protein
MRRALLVFGLALAALGSLGPALEAIAPCLVECVDEGPSRDCANSDQCCSCCVHPRLVATDVRGDADRLGSSTAVDTIAVTTVPSADPREILHVPKALLG